MERWSENIWNKYLFIFAWGFLVLYRRYRLPGLTTPVPHVMTFLAQFGQYATSVAKATFIPIMLSLFQYFAIQANILFPAYHQSECTWSVWIHLEVLETRIHWKNRKSIERYHAWPGINYIELSLKKNHPLSSLA